MHIVSRFGKRWARNAENIAKVPHTTGIYILFDGSMPLYVGKGNLRDRIDDARKSERRGQLWDRFSWFALRDSKMAHDLESLMLKMLPRPLRALNRQSGHFMEVKRGDRETNKQPELISYKWGKRKS